MHRTSSPVAHVPECDLPDIECEDSENTRDMPQIPGIGESLDNHVNGVDMGESVDRGGNTSPRREAMLVHTSVKITSHPRR